MTFKVCFIIAINLGLAICKFIGDSTEGPDKSYTHPLDGHDTETANEGADGNVNENVGLSISWFQITYEHDGHDNDGDQITDESRLG